MLRGTRFWARRPEQDASLQGHHEAYGGNEHATKNPFNIELDEFTLLQGSSAQGEEAAIDDIAKTANVSVVAGASDATPQTGMGSFLRTSSGQSVPSGHKRYNSSPLITGVNRSPVTRPKRKSLSQYQINPPAKRLQATPGSVNNHQIHTQMPTAQNQAPRTEGIPGGAKLASPGVGDDVRASIKSGTEAVLSVMESEASDSGMVFDQLLMDGAGTTFDVTKKEEFVSRIEAACLDAVRAAGVTTPKIVFIKAADRALRNLLGEAQTLGTVLGRELFVGSIPEGEIKKAQMWMMLKYKQIVDSYESAAVPEAPPSGISQVPETPLAFISSPHSNRHVPESPVPLCGNPSVLGLQQSNTSHQGSFSTAPVYPGPHAFQYPYQEYSNTQDLDYPGLPQDPFGYTPQVPVSATHSMHPEPFPSFQDSYQAQPMFLAPNPQQGGFDMPNNGGLNNQALNNHGLMSGGSVGEELISNWLQNRESNRAGFNNGAPS